MSGAFRLAIGLFLLPVIANASPADLYGGLPRGMATAGTQTANADDVGAPLYNPAGIALAGANGKTQLQLGFAYGQPFLNVDRAKNDTTSAKFQTRDPVGQGWYTAAGIFPLGGKIKNRASLGFSFYFPQSKFIRVEAIEPRDPQWLRHQSDPDRLVLAVGLGVRVTDSVSIGIGAHLLAALVGNVNFNIDVATKTVNRRDFTFDLKPGVAPAFGIVVSPHRDWRVALAYRGPLQLTVNQSNLIDLGGIAFDLDIKGSVLYTPHQIALGTQFHPTLQSTISFDLKYDVWSRAPFPGAELNVKVKGEIAEQLAGDAFNFGTHDGATGFTDTLTPSVSGEYVIPSQQVKLRGGYAFRPSYVPNQIQSSSNYLDTNTHIIGAGVTFQFHDPIEVFSQPLFVDLAAQMQIAQSRSVVKVNTSDPVGNYKFGGVAVAGTGSLRYEF